MNSQCKWRKEENENFNDPILQRLCAALHFGVGKLSADIGRGEGVTFDKCVVASLANVAFEKVRSDLDSKSGTSRVSDTEEDEEDMVSDSDRIIN